MKIYRLLFIISITFIVFSFGIKYGPKNQSAEAKVFERFLTFTENMPDYLFDKSLTSSPRKVIVNGNTTWLTVTKTNDDIENVLNFYLKQYKSQSISLPFPAEIKKEIQNSLGTDYSNIIEKIYKRGEYEQHFLMKRKDYGFLGIIDFHESDLAIGSEDFFKAIISASTSGKFGELAIGRVVIAMRNDKSKKTTVINIWTDRDFDLNNLQRDSNGEMPGFDFEDIAIYHSNKRLLSLEQDNPLAKYRVVQYEGEGALPAHLAFVHSTMASNGWNSDSAFEEAKTKGNAHNMFFYTKAGKECTIQIAKHKTQGKISTTIIESTLN